MPTQPLEPPETHYLRAAVGWLELGNLAESRAELDQIAVSRQNHPDVLEVRWLVSAQAARWDEGLQVARSLIHAAPERPSGWLHQAYALRRAPHGSLQKAWDALLPAYQKFPKETLIAFNLACYACQMGQLDSALVWLQRAWATSDKETIRAQALADPDLKPLWEQIQRL